MATKEELRKSIMDMEPNNETAKDSRSGREALDREFKAAKRRKALHEKDDAIPVDARYRQEESERLAWKFFSRATKKPVSGLFHGLEIPVMGSIIPADGDGPPLLVKSHSNGLGIVAGDLCIREEFDPRRIYNTPNGSTVVFKRMDKESGKTVLWSFKVNSEILVGPNIELERTLRTAKPVAQTAKRMTQKTLAAFLIGNNPDITGMELSEQLQAAFPSSRIGPRHGPHYLSLSRNGRLPEVPDSDPRTW